LARLFIVKPGIYWSLSDTQTSLKSRGAPRSIIGSAAHRFQDTFDDSLDVMRCPGAMDSVLKEDLIPSVPVTVRVFNACRLALARGKPWLSGKWEDVTRSESFEWSTKRDPMRVVLGEGFLTTFPIALSVLAESEGYKEADFDKLIEISGESGAPRKSTKICYYRRCLTSSRYCRASEIKGTLALRAPPRHAIRPAVDLTVPSGIARGRKTLPAHARTPTSNHLRHPRLPLTVLPWDKRCRETGGFARSGRPESTLTGHPSPSVLSGRPGQKC
jgi:hypothetical protein